MSSHVFIGEIQDVYFISTSGKRISARQAAQQIDYFHKQIEQAPESKQPQVFSNFSEVLNPVIETKIYVSEYLLQPKEATS